MKCSTTFWGAGSFANALVSCVSVDVEQVVMWGRREESFRPRCLSAVPTVSIEKAALSDIWIFCVPAQALRALLSRIKLETDLEPKILVLACKGIESESGLLMPEVAHQIFPGAPKAVIAGPNFASELSERCVSGVTLASDSVSVFDCLSALFSCDWVRLEHVAAVKEISAFGALKNIAAVGCGLLDQVTHSRNTKAAFVSGAFTESVEWISAHISEEVWASALCYGGLGDFVMSCTSDASRNFRYGRSFSLPHVAQEKELVEGVASVYGVLKRSQDYGIRLPFVEKLEGVFSGNIQRSHWAKALLGMDAG